MGSGHNSCAEILDFNHSPFNLRKMIIPNIIRYSVPQYHDVTTRFDLGQDMLNILMSRWARRLREFRALPLPKVMVHLDFCEVSSHHRIGAIHSGLHGLKLVAQPACDLIEHFT